MRISTLWRATALAAFACSLASSGFANSDPPASTVEPALRDLWVRGPERFHRQWLVAGPVDAELAKKLDPASLQPAAGQALTASDPGTRWRVQTSWTDVTDLAVLGGRESNASGQVDRFVYVAGVLQSPAGRPAELSIGSDRAYSVWLNGKPVHTRDVAAPFMADRDRVAVELQQGANPVLLRFHESSAGASQFALRVVAPGAALARIDEIVPSLAASTDDKLVVRTHSSAEPQEASVEVVVVAPGGEAVARASAPRGDTVSFDATLWRDGPYDVRVSSRGAFGQASTRYLPWYKGDAIAAVRQLAAAAAEAEQDVAGDTLRMLAALAKDRLGGAIDTAPRAAWRRVHSPLFEAAELQREAEGRSGAIRSSGFVRLAYSDDTDGSTQYCRAYLPAEYSAARRWPLILSLHGFNPANPEYIGWWSVEQRHHPIAEAKGTIFIEVHGRGNAQYLGIGERDVLRCLEEAKRRFAVDPNRLYVTGDSMGGHGTWVIASRHPDLFAAAAPVFGGWDFRVTSVSGPPVAPQPADVLDAFGLERASSFANAESLLHVPLLIIHGDADAAVSVENSRHAVRLLQRWGYDVRYHEMPGWAHEDLGQQAAIADWLLTHERNPAPRSVRVRSTDLASAAAYWLRVSALQNPAEIVRVSAHVLRPGQVRVDSTNVAALALDLPAELRGESNRIEVVWNGTAHVLTANQGHVELGSFPSSALRKRAGLEGPLPAVIATPFAVVVGTTSTDTRMRERIRIRADAFAKQWLRWQHQPVRLLDDTAVTAEHEKAYSLILIGGADANAVTRRFAKRLPFTVARNAITVDGRKFPVTDSVLQAIYPSPAAADRYVYVVAATSSDGMYFWRPQLVNFVAGFPLTAYDWVIQDGRRPPPGTVNPAAAHAAAGIFDASWRGQDRFVKVRDAQSASTWTLRRAPPQGFVASRSALLANAGRYELFPGFVLTIRVDGEKLVVDVPGEDTIRLVSESDAVFIDPATDNTVEFLRDGDGKISGLSVDTQGTMRLAKRLP